MRPSSCPALSPAPRTEHMSARLPIAVTATAGITRDVAASRVGRAYRMRSRAAKIALIPTILVMLGCYYASVTWTVYISMTRSFLLPVYKFAGATQYERLFATPRWQVAYGNMFL